MKTLVKLLLLIVIILLFTACAPAPAALSTPTSTPAPTHTPTLIPTDTPTPTITPTPTLVPTPTPVRLAYQSITKDDLSSLSLLKNIGVGNPLKVQYSTDGATFALIGSQSTCFFDGKSLEKIKCLDYGSINDIQSWGDVYLSDDFSNLAVSREQGEKIYFEMYDVAKNEVMYRINLDPDGQFSGYVVNDDSLIYNRFTVRFNHNAASISLRRWKAGCVFFSVSGENQQVETYEVQSESDVEGGITSRGIIYSKKEGARELVFLELADQVELFRINIFSERWGVVFSPDESLVAILDGSQIQIYDVVTWQLIKTIYSTGTWSGIYFSSSNQKVGIYTYAGSHNVLIYDVFENSSPISLFGNPRFGNFESFIFAPDDSAVIGTSARASGSRYMDGYAVTASAWDLKSREITMTFGATDRSLIAYSPDGEYLAYVEGPTQDRLELIRLSDSSLIGSYPLNITQVFAFSPDNRLLATAGSLYRVGIWDMETGELLQTYGDDLRDYDQSIDYRYFDIRQIGYSARGTYLAAHFLDAGIVRIWKAETMEVLLDIPVRQSGGRFTFSEDESLMAVSNFPESSGQTWGSIDVWRLADGKQIIQIPVSGHSITSIDMTADHGLLAASFILDQDVLVFDLSPCFQDSDQINLLCAQLKTTVDAKAYSRVIEFHENANQLWMGSIHIHFAHVRILDIDTWKMTNEIVMDEQTPGEYCTSNSSRNIVLWFADNNHQYSSRIGSIKPGYRYEDAILPDSYPGVSNCPAFSPDETVIAVPVLDNYPGYSSGGIQLWGIKSSEKKINRR